jgi:hypothetical protein
MSAGKTVQEAADKIAGYFQGIAHVPIKKNGSRGYGWYVYIEHGDGIQELEYFWRSAFEAMHAVDYEWRKTKVRTQEERDALEAERIEMFKSLNSGD